VGAARSGARGRNPQVLLLPGALATWAFYEDLLAEPSIRESGTRFVATTLPGFGGTSPPGDLSMEGYSSAHLAWLPISGATSLWATASVRTWPWK
jgi:pimeloyl-ACP methyl ester carboxylesterase